MHDRVAPNISRVPSCRYLLLPRALLAVLVARWMIVNGRRRTSSLRALSIMRHERYASRRYINRLLVVLLAPSSFTYDHKRNVQQEHHAGANTVCDSFGVNVRLERALSGKAQSQSAIGHTEHN